MLRISLEDKIYDLPESWKEVNVKQFIELGLYDGKDIITLLSILMQAPYDEVFVMTDGSIEKMIDSLSWYRADFDFEKLPVPEKINIGGADFVPPKDIKLKTYGQKIHFEDKMSGGDGPILKMAYVVGIYMYPIVSGKQFDDETIDTFVMDHILKCRILQVYPLAAFFLDSWQPSTRRKRRLLLQNMTKTRSGQVLKTLIGSG